MCGETQVRKGRSRCIGQIRNDWASAPFHLIAMVERSGEEGRQGTPAFLHSRKPSQSVFRYIARFAVHLARKLGMPDYPLTCHHSLILIAKAINRKWKMDRCDAAGSSLPPASTTIDIVSDRFEFLASGR